MSLLDGPQRGRSRPPETQPRNTLVEERRNAVFLVVLCALCCLWVFQGSQVLEKKTKMRQDRLTRLWDLRQEARSAVSGSGPDRTHLRELDGLFTGYRVVLRSEAAGPLLCLEPTGGVGGH